MNRLPDKWFCRVPESEFWKVEKLLGFDVAMMGDWEEVSNWHYSDKIKDFCHIRECYFGTFAAHGCIEITLYDMYQLCKPYTAQTLPPIKTEDALYAMRSCPNAERIIKGLWPDIFKGV